MPLRIRRSRAAREDLRQIWRYVTARDPDAADRLIERIIAATARLADLPESGSPKPNIHPDARSVPVPPYVIYYRVRANAVEIVAVRHGARDQASVSDVFKS